MTHKNFAQAFSKSLILVFLLLVPIVLAQGIEIDLIEYNPDTERARIQVTNNQDLELHNVKFQVDSFPPEKIGSVLKANGATMRIVGLSKGTHTITVISDEMTESRELSFQTSIEGAHEQFEDKQIEKRREVQLENVREKELEKFTPTTATEKAKVSARNLIIFAIAFIIGIIVYFFIKKKNEST